MNLQNTITNALIMISVKTGSLKKLLFKNGFYTKFVFKANFMVVWGGGLGTNFGF